MAGRYEDDPSMRDVAYTALLTRCPWFEDLRMNDYPQVVTDFLTDWREAKYRHATGSRSIYQWAVTWAVDSKTKYETRYPYLAGKEVKSSAS